MCSQTGNKKAQNKREIEYALERKNQSYNKFFLFFALLNENENNYIIIIKVKHHKYNNDL